MIIPPYADQVIIHPLFLRRNALFIQGPVQQPRKAGRHIQGPARRAAVQIATPALKADRRHTVGLAAAVALHRLIAGQAVAALHHHIAGQAAALPAHHTAQAAADQALPAVHPQEAHQEVQAHPHPAQAGGKLI